MQIKTALFSFRIKALEPIILPSYKGDEISFGLILIGRVIDYLPSRITDAA